MKSFFSTYLSAKYLLSVVSASSYEKFYLYGGAAIFLLPVIYRFYIFIRGNRPEVYRSFDKFWFWGYLALGLFGLWIWFSRSQSLPIFSTRLVSYAWILATLGFTAGLVYYFYRKIPQKLTKYYDKKRKSKYLK